MDELTDIIRSPEAQGGAGMHDGNTDPREQSVWIEENSSVTGGAFAEEIGNQASSWKRVWQPNRADFCGRRRHASRMYPSSRRGQARAGGAIRKWT